MQVKDIVDCVKSATKKWKDYPLNDVRDFFKKRQWLVGGPSPEILTTSEFQALMAKTLKLPKKRVDCIRAFIRGWTSAKR